MGAEREADVLIVGAGAVGAFFAARLARAGKRVVVLESGPPWQLGDLVSSQIWARRLKWGGAPVERSGAAPFGYNMATGWGLGGSALHHYGGWPRLHPEDFGTRSLYGRARDWPIDYDTLRPYYDHIQSECGVSGDASREVWRPPGAPYPMPPLPVFRQGELLARGFEQAGLRVAPAPLAINSIPYRGRAACLNDGWCDAGCPILALANPFALYIPRAIAAGAQFHTRTTATRVLLDTAGSARGVECVPAEGEKQTVHARCVILAASPVQNVRLLLASAQKRAPHGVGNEHGQVGRGFVCHNVVSIYGMFSEDTENHRGVSAGSLISQERYRKDSHPGGAFGSYQWGIAPALKPNDLLGIAMTRSQLWGQRLQEFIVQAARRLASMSALCETLPHEANRIELASSRDGNGVPHARVTRMADSAGTQLAESVAAEGLEIMKRAGAHEAWRGILATSHPLGGTVMGARPEDSVTDSYGRVHGVPGLLVAGGGVFPTAGGGSPTFTLLALAERAARELLSRPLHAGSSVVG